jgi:hypothetical protein
MNEKEKIIRLTDLVKQFPVGNGFFTALKRLAWISSVENSSDWSVPADRENYAIE